MNEELEARVRALEVVVTSFLTQKASEWGNDAVAVLDQWQADLVEHHKDDEEAVQALFDRAIRRFG